MGSMTDKALVDDQTSTANPLPKVEDSRKDAYTNVTIGAGMEMRRGNGRLQGFYGAELMFMMGSTKTTYTYGNAYDFTNLPSQTHGTDGSSDVLEVKSGSTIGLGVRGFVGCEYFVAAKISIVLIRLGLGFQARNGSQTVKRNSAGTALEDLLQNLLG